MNVCFVPKADTQRLILPATSEQVVMPLKILHYQYA